MTGTVTKFAPEARARALYDYVAREEDELSLTAGDVLKVVASHDDGWFLVQNAKSAFGVVPGNYLCHVSNSAMDNDCSNVVSESTPEFKLRDDQSTFVAVMQQGEMAARILEDALTALDGRVGVPRQCMQWRSWLAELRAAVVKAQTDARTLKKESLAQTPQPWSVAQVQNSSPGDTSASRRDTWKMMRREGSSSMGQTGEREDSSSSDDSPRRRGRVFPR